MTQPQDAKQPQASPYQERRHRPPTARLVERRRRTGASYSRAVSLMKLMFPLIAGILLLMIAIWPQIQGEIDKVHLSFNKLDVNEARDLRMVNTRYTGVDRQNRPFTITADVAREMPGTNDTISLEGPKADLTMTSGVWIALSADKGLYQSQPQTLDLTGNVDLFQDKGTEFRTASAHIDLAAGVAEGKEPIAGQGPFGNIEAEGFRLLDHGSTIVFTGKATIELRPAGKSAP